METFSALLAICAEIHRGPVNSPHKGQWRGAWVFSLICTRINGWVNNGEAGDLRHHRAHFDVIVMYVFNVCVCVCVWRWWLGWCGVGVGVEGASTMELRVMWHRNRCAYIHSETNMNCFNKCWWYPTFPCIPCITSLSAHGWTNIPPDS